MHHIDSYIIYVHTQYRDYYRVAKLVEHPRHASESDVFALDFLYGLVEMAATGTWCLSTSLKQRVKMFKIKRVFGVAGWTCSSLWTDFFTKSSQTCVLGCDPEDPNCRVNGYYGNGASLLDCDLAALADCRHSIIISTFSTTLQGLCTVYSCFLSVFFQT